MKSHFPPKNSGSGVWDLKKRVERGGTHRARNGKHLHPPIPEGSGEREKERERERVQKYLAQKKQHLPWTLQ